MRIALVQQHATSDLEDNLRRGLEALQQAAAEGAQLVCYPELAFEPFYPQVPTDELPLALAQEVPGPLTDAFSLLAARLGVVVVLNLYEREGERCFDCSPVIDADGSLLGRARMVHITDYDCFHERSYYSPGDTGASVFETAVGKLGVAICYDRHYPEYMRALALGGAELVVVPQAGAVGEWPAGLYEAELQVAAFQNGYFTALCNRVGREERLEFAGASFACAPDGQIIAQAPEREDHLLVVDLDLQQVETSAAKELFLKDRRPDVYSEWLASEAAARS